MEKSKSSRTFYQEDPDDIALAVKVNLLRKQSLRKKIETRLISGAFETFGGVNMTELKDRGWAYPILLLFNAIFFTTLIYLTISNMQAMKQNQFLSLEANSTTQICYEVPSSLSGRFEGDVNGNWETSQDFNYNSSVFYITFTGSHIDNAQYESVMKGFSNRLALLGTKAARRDEAWNAMVWSSWSFFDDASNMKFTSTADAGIIYNQDVIVGILTSSTGVCQNLHQYGSFSAVEKTIAYNIPSPIYPDQALNATGNLQQAIYGGTTYDFCPSMWQMWWLNWDPTFNGKFPTYQVKFDIRTIAFVMSLNMGIMTRADFVETTSAWGAAAISGAPGNFFIEPNHAPMAPIFCVNKTLYAQQFKIPMTRAQINGPEICFYVAGGANTTNFFYPMTVAMKTDPLTGHVYPCNCPNDQSNYNCNFRDIVISMIYDTVDNLGSFKFALKMQQLLVNDPINGDLAMQHAIAPVMAATLDIAYDPSVQSLSPKTYTTSAGTYDYSFLNGKTYGQALIAEWNKLCPWGSCGAFVFESYKTEQYDNFVPINKYNFQLRNTPGLNATYVNPAFAPIVFKREACANTLYMPVAMKKFIATPPVFLVQAYYRCHMSDQAAFYAAIGSAAGSANVLSTAALGIMGFIIIRVFNWLKKRQARQQLANGKEPTAQQFLQNADIEKIAEAIQEMRQEQLIAVIGTLVEDNKALRDEVKSQGDVLRRKGASFRDYVPPSTVDMGAQYTRLKKLYDFNPYEVTSPTAKDATVAAQKDGGAAYEEESRKDDFDNIITSSPMTATVKIAPTKVRELTLEEVEDLAREEEAEREKERTRRRINEDRVRRREAMELEKEAAANASSTSFFKLPL